MASKETENLCGRTDMRHGGQTHAASQPSSARNSTVILPEALGRMPARFNPELNSSVGNNSNGRSFFAPCDEPATASASNYRAFVERRTTTFANVVSHSFKIFLGAVRLQNEDIRRLTFVMGCCTLDPHLVIDLAKNGYFYLGNLDRTQCFSCGGVLRNWMPGDNVSVAHRERFPHCRMALGTESDNVAIVAETKRSVSAFIRKVLENADFVEERLGSLTNCAYFFPFRNPYYEIHAQSAHRSNTVEVLEGLGSGNECWYCNGGLQQWNPQDEPWVENSYCCSGCACRIRLKWMTFIRRLWQSFRMQFPTILVNHLTSYDVPSMALAMGIGRSNVRIGSVPDCIEINLELEAKFRIAPPTQSSVAVAGSGTGLSTAQTNARKRRHVYTDRIRTRVGAISAQSIFLRRIGCCNG